MTLRKTPKIEINLPQTIQAYEPPQEAVEKWHVGLKAEAEGNNVISILDVIGEDFWGDGISAKRVSGALRSIKASEIVVDLNSPGGDFFEGVAIYNMLRNDDRKVTVRVLGIAASAASVIAMAADEVQIAEAGFLMVHEAWGIVVGNKRDLAETIETLKPFDEAMALTYAKKAGVSVEQAAEWMEAETYFTGAKALEIGLADAFLTADIVDNGDKDGETNAMRRVDTLLAQGKKVPRSERRALLKEVTGSTPGAASNATQDAGELAADVAAFLKSMKTEQSNV